MYEINAIVHLSCKNIMSQWGLIFTKINETWLLRFEKHQVLYFIEEFLRGDVMLSLIVVHQENDHEGVIVLQFHHVDVLDHEVSRVFPAEREVKLFAEFHAKIYFVAVLGADGQGSGVRMNEIREDALGVEVDREEFTILGDVSPA